MINLSRDDLKSMLGVAFERGWSGCLDMKSECVEKMLDELESKQSFASISLTSEYVASGLTISTAGYENISAGYYSYGAGGLLTSIDYSERIL